MLKCLWLSLLASPLLASQIQYTISLTASGTFDNVPFTNTSVVFRGSQLDGSAFALGDATVSVGSATNSLYLPSLVFENCFGPPGNCISLVQFNPVLVLGLNSDQVAMADESYPLTSAFIVFTGRTILTNASNTDP